MSIIYDIWSAQSKGVHWLPLFLICLYKEKLQMCIWTSFKRGPSETSLCVYGHMLEFLLKRARRNIILYIFLNVKWAMKVGFSEVPNKSCLIHCLFLLVRASTLVHFDAGVCGVEEASWSSQFWKLSCPASPMYVEECAFKLHTHMHTYCTYGYRHCLNMFVQGQT